MTDHPHKAFTDADVELVAGVINDPLRGEAEAVLNALAAAGRLRPLDEPATGGTDSSGQ